MLVITVISWTVCILGSQVERSSFSDWQGIDSLMIELVSEIREVDDAGNETLGLMTHRRVGFSKDGRVYYFSGHDERAKGEEWTREPYNLELAIGHGQMITHKHFQRAYETQEFPQDAELPRSLSSDSLMFVLPYWLPKQIRSPGDFERHIYFITDEAIGTKYYGRLQEERVIDGLNCVGYRNREGTDQFWIAPDCQNLVIEREWYSNDQKSKGYKLRSVQYREFEEGLWLPSKYVVSYSEDAWENIRSFRTTRILRVQTNVPRRQFDCHLKDGSVRLTGSNEQIGKGFVQTHPGGTQLLEDVALLIRSKQSGNRTEHTAVNMFISLAGLGFGMAVIGWVFAELCGKNCWFGFGKNFGN